MSLTHSRSDGATGISTVVQFSLAAIAGAGAANVYYHQPVLGQIMQAFGLHAATYISTATLLGYGLGILLLVPLGDTKARRSLIATQQVILVISLFIAAFAPSLPVLTAICVLIGAFATTAQQAIPFAAELATAQERGRAVGRAMTGLLLGVLLARTASGLVGEEFGWRMVFMAAAALSALMGVIARFGLPYIKPASTLKYPALLKSVFVLIREEPVLRWATLTQGLNFAAFNAFWAALTLHLASPAFNLGSAQAGMFGLIGAVGALVAPQSGRLADRFGPHRVVMMSTLMVVLAFIIFATRGATSLVGIGLGVLIMDIGVTSAMVANQSRIYALRPHARGRLNTVFMTGAFGSGGLGALISTQEFIAGGWEIVCLTGGIFGACACLAAWATPKKSAQPVTENKQ